MAVAKFCSECGSALVVSGKCCSECGSPIAQAGLAEVSATAVDRPASPESIPAGELRQRLVAVGAPAEPVGVGSWTVVMAEDCSDRTCAVTVEVRGRRADERAAVLLACVEATERATFYYDEFSGERYETWQIACALPGTVRVVDEHGEVIDLDAGWYGTSLDEAGGQVEESNTPYTVIVGDPRDSERTLLLQVWASDPAQALPAAAAHPALVWDKGDVLPTSVYGFVPGHVTGYTGHELGLSQGYVLSAFSELRQRLVAIGAGALAAGDQDTAREVFTRAAEAGDAVMVAGLGALAFADDDADQARAWWRKAADAGRLRALVTLGLLANSQGDPDEAAALWAEAVDRWSGDEEQRGSAVEVMVRLGAHANDHGDRDEEVLWLDRAAAADPADPIGWVFGVDGMREVSWRPGTPASEVLAGVAAEEGCPDGPWQAHPVEWACAVTLWALDPSVGSGLGVNDIATRLLAQYPDPPADQFAPDDALVLHGPTVLTRPEGASGLPGIPRPVLEMLDGFTDLPGG